MIPTLVNTVRYLKPEQVRGRLLRETRWLVLQPSKFAATPAPHFPGCSWQPPSAFLAPRDGSNAATEIARGDFAFVNEARSLGTPVDWTPAGASLLWLYHLHYFDYVWVLGYTIASRLALDWIRDHALARHRVGWHPYPTSLRLVNWCCYFLGRHRERTCGDAPVIAALWPSIFLQAEWLSRNLEMDLQANHLLENAAALAVAGACFDGNAARRWLDLGATLLRREVREQVLSDGMHFERSPMYHVRVMHVLTVIANTGNEELRQIVTEPLERMVRALDCLCHPDGDIALFNDSVHGQYHRPKELIDYVGSTVAFKRPPQPTASAAFALEDAGYYGARDQKGCYILYDAGPVGPDCNPGHGHGDLFSFELSVHGHRVVVDSGVFDYGSGAIRKHCRSTRAHNTVEVDRKDQSEFWGTFRVARRARPHDVKWQQDGDRLTVSGWHDGYLRLAGTPRHYRRCTWYSAGLVMIRDHVVASQRKKVHSRLHLHPSCEIEDLRRDRAIICTPSDRVVVYYVGGDGIFVEKFPYCPEFGVAAEGSALVVSASGAELALGFCVSWGIDGEGSLDLERGLRVGDKSYPW